jgi:ankyrin repeat protein
MKTIDIAGRRQGRFAFHGLAAAATALLLVGCVDIDQAARDGNLAKVQALLKSHPEQVDKRDPATMTPLHLAAQEGHKDMAELLLANKADVNAKAADGWTPLHLATQNGHKDVAELLLANKADVNAKATDGSTPLHLAAAAGATEVAQLLLEHDADAVLKANDGAKPAERAEAAGHKDVVALINKYGEYKTVENPDEIGLKIDIQATSVMSSLGGGGGHIEGKVKSLKVGKTDVELSTDQLLEQADDQSGKGGSKAFAQQYIQTKRYGKILVTPNSYAGVTIMITDAQREKFRQLYKGGKG